MTLWGLKGIKDWKIEQSRPESPIGPQIYSIRTLDRFGNVACLRPLGAIDNFELDRLPLFEGPQSVALDG